tara:strand:- start:799 stop:1833 length:1035 start_codon:yes stop_codon:yes gene_type:complete
MKTVLHIINWINIRGSERICFNTAKYSPKYKHVFVAHTIGCKNALENFEKYGKVVILPEVTPLSFEYIGILDLIKSEDIDIVHLYLPGDDLPPYVLSIKVPIILTILCTKYCNFKRPPQMKYVVASSKYAASLSPHLNPLVVPAGVEKVEPKLTREDFFKEVLPGISTHVKIVSRIGALEPLKHPLDFIKVANLLKDDQSLIFVMAGIGEESYLNYLKSQVASPNFRFLGKVSEDTKSEILDKSSVYLYPTEFEAFGFSVVEPMSHGCPVISYQNTAMPEVIGDSGILVPTNDISALVKATTSISGNESKRSILSLLSKDRWGSLYQCQTYANTITSLYENCHI